MAASAIPAEIRSVRIDTVLQGLIHQLQGSRPRRIARPLYSALAGAVYCLPILVFSVISARVLSDGAEAGMLSLPQGLHRQLDAFAAWLNGLVAPLLFLVVLLVFFNLPLAVLAFRERGLQGWLRALGLRDDLSARKRDRRWWRPLRYLLYLPPLFFALAFLVSLPGASASVSWGRSLAAFLLLIFLPLLLLALDWVFARLELRLAYQEEIEWLQKELQAARAGGSGEVPARLLGRLVQAETTGILLESTAMLREGRDLPVFDGAAAEAADGKWWSNLSATVEKALDEMSQDTREVLEKELAGLLAELERRAPGSARRGRGLLGREGVEVCWHCPAALPNLALIYLVYHPLRRLHFWRLIPLAVPNRRVEIFLSYSHDNPDSQWFVRLKKELEQLEHYNIFFWTDEGIDPADRWKKLILAKVNSADGVLLLMSPSYMESDFIRRHELPRFLEREEQDPSGKFFFFWVPVAEVKDLEKGELGRRVQEVQALIDLEEPLVTLWFWQRKARLARVREQVHRTIYARFQS